MIAIDIENVGKKYKLSHGPSRYVALRDVIAQFFKHPFRTIADRRSSTEQFWALRGVNVKIEQGNAIGIIGANGAGKSTLLKILTGITPPTEGQITMRGRVASLLEVGTGFHPELTGRENIFLNGAILGMTKKEMVEKFDDIISFAGIEKFLDTPVKYYSSGMYVRLAFSVAAHMEPDILLVDEVLAVGDAEFQKKCLGKMDEVTKKAGRTILFVSHNMGAIQRLCKKTILMEGGKAVMYGDTSEVIEYYLKRTNSLANIPVSERKDRSGNGDLRITDCYLKDREGHKTNQVITGEATTLVFEYECKPGKNISNITIGANVSNADNASIFLCNNQMTKTNFGTISGRGSLECTIDRIPLIPASYYVSVRISENDSELDSVSSVLKIDVLPGDFFGTGSSIIHSQIYIDQQWNQRDI